MTSSEQYTPSVEAFRAKVAEFDWHQSEGMISREESGAEFDRMIAQVQAEACEKALQDAADAWAADTGSWGDCEKDYQAELRDRARRTEKGAE